MKDSQPGILAKRTVLEPPRYSYQAQVEYCTPTLPESKEAHNFSHVPLAPTLQQNVLVFIERR